MRKGCVAVRNPVKLLRNSAKLLAKLPRNSAKPRGYSYVHWCRDEDMFADPLTKVANKHKYLKFTKVFFNIRN